MGSPDTPKVRTGLSRKEREKQLAAEERVRRSLSANRGVAANILAAEDTFGTSKSARTMLGGSDILGGR